MRVISKASYVAVALLLSACEPSTSTNTADVAQEPAVENAQPASSNANLLFKSGFEGDISLGPLDMYRTGAWQDVVGTDSESGFTWPPNLYAGTGARLQLIAGDSESVTSSTLPGYMHNKIESVSGRNQNSTRALYSEVTKSVGGADQNRDSTQNVLQIFPGTEQGDLYISYWLKLQPDLLELMTVNHWATRSVTAWKTKGDYRFLVSVVGDRANSRLYWHMRLDNVSNGGLPEEIFWDKTNTALPVPLGKWFRVEMFVHRSHASDGRIWFAVNGVELFQHDGANMGVHGLPWNRVMPFTNYSTGQILPAYQWVDDLEIWDGFPASASAH